MKIEIDEWEYYPFYFLSKPDEGGPLNVYDIPEELYEEYGRILEALQAWEREIEKIIE